MRRYRTVFVDIDTQFDFMNPAGRLYVPEADTIVPVLGELFEYAARRQIPVLSSADSHQPDEPEFEQFGPHCLAGTPGQAKLPETLLPRRTVVQPQQQLSDPAALLDQYQQVIFHKRSFNVFSNPNMGRLVEAIHVERYVVFGVATDYCVRAAALELLNRGQQVLIVQDAIKAVAPETARSATEELSRAGARWCRSGELIE